MSIYPTSLIATTGSIHHAGERSMAPDAACPVSTTRAKLGTAMPTRIAGEDVVIHPQGVVVKVADGTILAKGLGSTGPNSPLIQDGKVFFVAGQLRGYNLPTTADFPTKWEPLWKGANLKGGGYWFPSAAGSAAGTAMSRRSSACIRWCAPISSSTG